MCVVEIDLISESGIGIHLISLERSELTSFCVGGENDLVLVEIEIDILVYGCPNRCDFCVRELLVFSVGID